MTVWGTVTLKAAVIVAITAAGFLWLVVQTIRHEDQSELPLRA
jgi:hypothetical protein